jgi:prophage antirepressor-like protein
MNDKELQQFMDELSNKIGCAMKSNQGWFWLAELAHKLEREVLRRTYTSTNKGQ